MKGRNSLNSQKMKYCKKKIVWNVLKNNWVKKKKICKKEFCALLLFAAYTFIEYQE